MANDRRRRGGYFGNGGASGGRFGMSLTGPGTIFTISFIALAIGMGILLSRGVTPKTVLSDPGETGDLELVLETPAANGSRLQLKTLKFRECASKAAVGLIIDRSGSMRGAKITNLQDALTTFTSGLGNQSVIGMISFSTNTTEDVPFSRYQDVKRQVTSAIASYNPPGGSTHTRSAFTLMKDKILAAKAKYPQNDFALIVLTDGIPEDAAETGTCPSGRTTKDANGNPRCFALTQDPTQDPSIAKEIRDAGINVYAIAIYDKNAPDDIYFLPDMRNMMQNIVNDPANFYETPDPTKLKQIYKEIAQKICSDL